MKTATSTETATVSNPAVISQTASYLPLALIDKCIGSRIWIIMKDDKELVRRFFIKAVFANTFTRCGLGWYSSWV